MMKKPKIRFKGFNDDWEQNKFGELADYKKGPFGSAITKSMFVPKDDDSIKVYEQQNAINKDWSLERYFLPKSYVADKLKSFEVHSGDIIVSCAGTIGEIYEIPDNAESGVINQALMRVRVDENAVDKKMFITLFSNMIDAFTRTHSNGSAIKNIPPFADLKPMEVLLPSMNEQKNISGYLGSLDYLIILQRRKCEQTKKLKKYMLQNMFPQNGEKTPKIRFDGFTDDWEQCKLGDVVQITMGQSPDGSTYSDVPSDYILVQGNADLQNGWVCPRIWTSQVTKKADAGDLIMSVRAPAGTMGKTAYNAVIGRGVAAIKGNEFIYQLLVKMDSDGFWKTFSCGSTFESLNSDNIKNAEIKIPNHKEQEVIGAYFENLDNLITLHQRKCDKLQNIKKFMLQNMFV